MKEKRRKGMRGKGTLCPSFNYQPVVTMGLSRTVFEKTSITVKKIAIFTFLGL